MKKVIVLSLGGSQIIPEDINKTYLEQFKKVIQKHKKNYKFVVVTGGGSLARKYIKALPKNNRKLQSLAGIAATRTNARFMTYFFGIDQPQGVPHTMESVKNYLKRRDVVFCGALEYKPNQTSDTTAAQVANHFKTEFINITNVNGLYTKNPKKHKDAKRIPNISWNEFETMAHKITFTPGQHFVLDQTAATLIKRNKVKTYIVGTMKDLDNLLAKKKFRGTTIEN